MKGHDFSEQIEKGLGEALPGITFSVHLELSEDPASFEDKDKELDR